MNMPWFNISGASTFEIVLFFLIIAIIVLSFPIGIIAYAKKFGKFSETQLAYISNFLRGRKISQKGISIFIDILKKENINFYRIVRNNNLAIKIIVRNIEILTIDKSEKEVAEIKNEMYLILDNITSFYKAKSRNINSQILASGSSIWVKHNKDSFYTFVQNIDEETILIDADEVMFSTFKIDDSVEVHFVKKDDSSYSFETTVLKKINNRDSNTIVLSHADKVKRHQLRKVLRKQCSLFVDVYGVVIVKEDGKSKADMQDLVVKGEIKDISSGGVRIEYDSEFSDKYEYYYLKFIINGNEVHALSKLTSFDITNLHMHFIKVFKNKKYIINDFIYSSFYQKIIEEDYKTMNQ